MPVAMSTNPTTILVVDDNPASRYIIVKMLQRARYTVKEAATGREALRLTAEKPDLVILDVGLPDLSGYEVCQIIRSDPATCLIPVLHLSASFAETENRVRGLEGGADGYLTYPVEPPELLANVQALLRVREAERQVREQRELLRVTLSSIGDGVIATDTRGRVTFINHVAETLTGWGQSEAAGRPVADVFQIVNEGSDERVENPVDRVIQQSTKASVANHTVLLAKDGTRRPIDDTAAPISDDQGNILGVVLIFRDITQRRRTEQRQATQLAVTRILAESVDVADAVPQLLAAIGENTGWEVGHMWSVDPDGGRLRRQKSWSASTVSAEALAAASREATLLPGDSLPGRVWRTGRPDWMTNVGTDADFDRSKAANPSELRTSYAFPIPDTGTVIAVMEFFSRQTASLDEVLLEMTADVGRQLGQFVERRRAEHELRASESRLRRLVESNIIGVFFATEDRITEANDAFLQMVGYRREDVVAGRLNWRAMTPPEHHHLDDQSLKELIATKVSSPFSKEYFRKDGSRVSILIGAAELSADPLSWVCFVLDLTERNRLEEQLRDRARELAAESLRKDEFLAMLAHELRNPLTPIRNAAEILRLTGDQGSAARQAVEMVERQVQHVTRLVDDLLNVSRVSQGKIQLRKEKVDLATVVARALEQVRTLVDDRNHELTVTLPTRPVHLEGDVTRLVQILANLLSNAAKYTDYGGRIGLTAVRENDELVIRIRDSGIGIKAEMLPHIFELFVQSEQGLDRAQGGLGIGLTLARTLVEMHGGRITASSEGPGRGSEFVVRLKALPEERAKEFAGWEQTATQTIAPAARRRILIVDDNVDSAASLAILLQLQRHHVEVAHDGREALEAVRVHQPDIVILDIGLPGMDGYEVARQLRQMHNQNDLMLVAMTGYGQAEDRRRSQEAGFNAHLVKPADLDALQKLLTYGESRAQIPAET
jgi:PAS domain S-box-containing protein